MLVPPTPTDESRRLAALNDYQLLDSPNEEVFDALTRLAATLCGTPISLISLIDRDRQWFKSNVGLTDIVETQREVSFCAHAIGADGNIFEIPDALADGRFADNPLVTGAPNMRFYAGVPLVTEDGDALGTICVIDRKPRELTNDQRAGLHAIADAIMQQFQARRALLRLFDSADTELYQIDIAQRRIIFASEAARRNLGYDLRGLQGLDISDVLPALTRERLADRLAQLRADPQHHATLNSVARRRDGTTYPIELRIELMTSRARPVALVFGTDLTEQTAANERIHLLSAAMEATEDAVIISRPGATADEPATVVYVNQAFLQKKGATNADVIGKPMEQFLGPKSDRATLRDMRDALMRGESSRIEYITYRLDGSQYYAGLAARPLIDERGQTTHFVVMEHDVTESVLRGAQLAMQNERLTALTSVARGIFAALEPHALVEALLIGARELVGAEARLLVARPNGGFAVTTDLNVPDDAPSAPDRFLQSASRSDVTMISDDETRAAIRIPGALGQTRYLLDVRSERPLHTADIFALGLLGQYFAVATRNVELYGELQTRRAAVVELNQVKNDLIAMLAHDFKGPLTTIVGFADVLAEDERFDEESRKFLAMISSSAMRLASLATDTLALSRLEQNELTLNVEEFDLVALVKDIVRVFSVTREIDLHTDRPELVVGGDPARLRQVFENLIGNAIKYSPGGEPIDVSLRAHGRGVEVSVRDTGIGIPEADKAKLFGRFARAQNARAMGIGGTGFGLYLTKTIIEMHGGTIAVDSREGVGSTFRVFVPASISAPRPQHRRFILVDAEGDAKSYIAHTLRDDGFAVTVVEDGASLLAQIDEVEFDAALVEVEKIEFPLPELIRRVAGRTALVRIDTTAVGETDGWDAYLVKPFLMKDMQAAIDAAIMRHPKRRPEVMMTYDTAATTA